MTAEPRGVINMQRQQSHLHQSGFTLVELMIALAVGAILAIATYSAYRLQVKTATAQDAVSQMQQNLRAGLDILVNDLQLAGYDPTNSGKFTFVSGVSLKTGGDTVSSNATQIAFRRDLDSDGTVDVSLEDVNSDGAKDLSEVEQVAYKVAADDDGIVKLLRYSTEGADQWLPVAENIEAVEFYYKLADGTQTLTPSATQLNNIRSVQISMLARAEQRDARYENNDTYTPASGNTWDLSGDPGDGTNAPGDNYRRRLYITTVVCRNLGI